MLRNVRIIRKSTSLIITKKCFRQYRNDRISGAALCGICSILRQIREKKVAHKGVIQKVWLHMIGKIKKDAFYLYKAYWTEKPFVHICSKRFQKRPGDTTTIKVYATGIEKAELWMDGKRIQEQKGHIVSCLKVLN